MRSLGAESSRSTGIWLASENERVAGNEQGCSRPAALLWVEGDFSQLCVRQLLTRGLPFSLVCLKITPLVRNRGSFIEPGDILAFIRPARLA